MSVVVMIKLQCHNNYTKIRIFLNLAMKFQIGAITKLTNLTVGVATIRF